MPAAPLERCPQCGALVALVFVHGHGQCPSCKGNVAPCCAGSGDEAHPTAGRAQPFAADLFARLFVQLGGNRATLSTDCITAALVQVLDCDLDEARAVLAAGLATGVLESAGDDAIRLRPR